MNNIEEKKSDNIMNSIRVFVAIILATVVFTELTDSWSNDSPSLIITLMSLFILAWSFKPVLDKNKKIARIVIGVLVFLLILGVIFLIFRK